MPAFPSWFMLRTAFLRASHLSDGQAVRIEVEESIHSIRRAQESVPFARNLRKNDSIVWE